MFGIGTAMMVILAMYAPAGNATVYSASTNFESGTLSAFSQVNELNGSISVVQGQPYAGQTAVQATYNGSGLNGYARGIWNVDWEDGDNVWFGAAYYLPTGFLSNVQGQVDLVRWDNWSLYPEDTDWGGISIYGSDHKARLLRFGAGRPNDTLVGPFELPEGRWFNIEVHQIRSQTNGSALSEVYLDGQLIGRSTLANTYGRPATRIRYGIVAIAAGAQTKPLTLNFNNPEIRSGATGEEPTTTGGASETQPTQPTQPTPTPTPEPPAAGPETPAPTPAPVPTPPTEPVPPPGTTEPSSGSGSTETTSGGKTSTSTSPGASSCKSPPGHSRKLARLKRRSPGKLHAISAKFRFVRARASKLAACSAS